LPQLLEDVPLDKQSRMYFQHDGAPHHSSRGVTNFLNYRFPGRWIGRCLTATSSSSSFGRFRFRCSHLFLLLLLVGFWVL
jgi:hypothetical protein